MGAQVGKHYGKADEIGLCEPGNLVANQSVLFCVKRCSKFEVILIGGYLERSRFRNPP